MLPGARSPLSFPASAPMFSVVSAHFDVPLNLPHATTVALRLVHHLERLTTDEPILELADRLVGLLAPWQVEDRNPRPEERGVIDEVAQLGRALVGECERLS